VRALQAVLVIGVLIVCADTADAQLIYPSKPACAQTLPAGLVIRVEPDERIIAGRTDGPLLLTVTSDVRLFPGRPPIVPRSSKVFATTVVSKDAGHLKGRARYQMSLGSILTPNDCEYALDARVVDAGKYEVQKGAVVGKGHAKRDFLLTLFPPTTLYELVRVPARGPRLVLDNETILAIRLLQPVTLDEH